VIRRISLLFVAALLMMAVAVPAFAASPSQEQCKADGGTFSSERGTKTCTIIVTSDKNSKFTNTTETSGQGNTGNKTQGPSQDCDPTGSDKCPPGQF